MMNFTPLNIYYQEYYHRTEQKTILAQIPARASQKSERGEKEESIRENERSIISSFEERLRME